MKGASWLAWVAAIFSAAAAIGGLWSGYEAHRQVNLSTEESTLETAVATVRYCDVNRRDRMKSGDDLEELTVRPVMRTTLQIRSVRNCSMKFRASHAIFLVVSLQIMAACLF